MSRVGKQPIPVPSGVDVSIDGARVTVKGPKGTLEHDAPSTIALSRDGDDIVVTRTDDERENRALHGLTRSLVANMVRGVSEGYERELEIVGVGYRATAQGPAKLELQLGFSHPVHFEAPEGITFEVPQPTRITVAWLRQAAGRPGRRQHPEDPQARALQGQGHPVRRRVRPPQGRQVGEVVDEDVKRCRRRRRAGPGVTAVSARRCGAPRRDRA